MPRILPIAIVLALAARPAFRATKISPSISAIRLASLISVPFQFNYDDGFGPISLKKEG